MAVLFPCAARRVARQSETGERRTGCAGRGAYLGGANRGALLRGRALPAARAADRRERAVRCASPRAILLRKSDCSCSCTGTKVAGVAGKHKPGTLWHQEDKSEE